MERSHSAHEGMRAFLIFIPPMSKPHLPNLNQINRVLIIRLSSIGDVVHATPLSVALSEAFPHLEISWLVEEMSAEIVQGNPYLKEVIVVPRSRWKKGGWNSLHIWREKLAFLSSLRARKFDLTLDLQGYAKSGVMALATGAKHRIGWRRLRDGSEWISQAVPPRPESLHRVEWFLDVVGALGVQTETVNFPLTIPDSARQSLNTKLNAYGIEASRPYLVLNLATGNEVRRWGVEKYAELVLEIARRHPYSLILIGSKKDKPLNQALLDRIKPHYPESLPPPVDLAGETNLKELMALLEQTAVHITGDTGSTHIAAAMGIPTLSLYGPTDPVHAGAWGQAERTLSHRELCTRGCGGKECAHPCLRKHPATEAGESPNVAACLDAITAQDVLKLLEALPNVPN